MHRMLERSFRVAAAPSAVWRTLIDATRPT